jgi:hypothetical protein
MRRVLVDAARAKAADKRGGGAEHVTLVDVPVGDPDEGLEVIALDTAARKRSPPADPRKARVVELRVFGGLTVQETASGPESLDRHRGPRLEFREEAG